MSSNKVPWSTFRNSWSHTGMSSVRFSLFSSSSGGGGSSLWWVHHWITCGTQILAVSSSVQRPVTGGGQARFLAFPRQSRSGQTFTWESGFQNLPVGPGSSSYSDSPNRRILYDGTCRKCGLKMNQSTVTSSALWRPTVFISLLLWRILKNNIPQILS